MVLFDEPVKKIQYKFIFEDGTERIFSINIDTATLTIIRESNDNLPGWAKLDSFKCPNCPLNITENEYCPIAVNLKDIIAFFSDIPSFEKAKTIVKTPDRTYYKHTPVQDGVGAIVGLIMASSGCPILGKLKPLVKFHLPFASIDETEYRVFAMYVLAQFIRNRNGKEADWELKKLKDYYDDIKIVNQNVARKIADLEKLDTSINAVVVLNNFADTVTFSVDENDLSMYENLLKEWLH